jgi:excisionase family DNA binding protein
MDEQRRPQLLTIEEAAQRLRIGRTKAYEMAATGELPTVRLGRLVRIPERRLNEMIEGRPAAAS